MSGCLLIRADAGAAIGAGHVMRCLALAQGFVRAGVRCLWARASAPAPIEERVRGEGLEPVAIEAEPGSARDADCVAAVAAREGADWIVVDGYRFTSAYQQRLHDCGRRVLWLDDQGRSGPFVADLVLNPNIAVSADWYRERSANTRLLLGPRFALLRREIVSQPPSQRDIAGTAARVLVSLGGADPANATADVVRALAALDGLHVRVLVGPAYSHRDTLPHLLTGAMEVVEPVSDIRAALEWADAAVLGAGTTAWEAAYLGVPSAVVAVAEDQRGNAEELARRGAAVYAGAAGALDVAQLSHRLRALVHDHEARRRMAERAQQIVDGRGASRVVAAMREAQVRLRPVTRADAERLWLWANEPAVRAASFSSAPIAWEEHLRWFTGKLADPECVLWIAETEAGEAIGPVRFDVDGASGVISMSIGVELRGRGYAGGMIRAACRRLLASHRVEAIDAFIRHDNDASRGAFRSAGFTMAERCSIRGIAAERLTLPRSEME